MTIRQKIDAPRFKDILKNNRVRKIALFGSYVNARPGKNSDLDFLVDFENEADLFDQAGLKNDLEHYLNKNVDLVTRAGLNKYIKATVLKEAIQL